MSVLEASGNRSHQATVNASETTRQAADAAALATYAAGGSVATYSASLKTDIVADYKRRLTSAIATGVPPGPYLDGLRTALGTYFF
jgi:hypothetical protein